MEQHLGRGRSRRSWGQVNSIKAAAKGMKELLAPFDAGIVVVGFYQTDDGAVVEFMEMKEEKKL